MAQYKKGIAFLGNANIRGAGVPVEWDKHKQMEWRRCQNDALYFIENYVYIKNVDYEQKILFKPRPYQKKMLQAMLDDRFVISRWPRQCGKTLIVSAMLLWYLIFHENFSILCAAHQGNKARDIIGMVQDMFMELPDFLQHGVTEWNKGSFKLSTNSRIRASATSASSARGDTYNMVYLDEFAFVLPHVADEFVRSVFPTISSGEKSKLFITSTPKGLNLFYTMWKQAIEKTNGFTPVAVEWNEVPGRDEAFRQKIIDQFGQTNWDQEYACSFIGSSRTLISGPKLLSLVTEQPLIDTPTYRLYEKVKQGHQYAITVDVADGVEADSSICMVFDVTTMPYKVVAIYRDNLVQPLHFPPIIYKMANEYNQATVLVEANFGQQIADILWSDMEYEHIVMTSRSKKQGETVSGGFAAQARPGVVMNKVVKRIGCTNLKTLIERDQLLVTDGWTYDELCRFSANDKGSYEAEAGHDDLVMCMVMFAWMVDQGFVKAGLDHDLRKKIADMNAEHIANSMAPLGFRITGHEQEIEAIRFKRDRDKTKEKYPEYRGTDLPSDPRVAMSHDDFMKALFSGMLN